MSNDRMLYVNGSNRSFRCDCGCNVFKPISPPNDLKGQTYFWPMEEKYSCNSCGAIYTTEKDNECQKLEQTSIAHSVDI